MSDHTILKAFYTDAKKKFIAYGQKKRYGLFGQSLKQQSDQFTAVNEQQAAADFAWLQSLSFILRLVIGFFSNIKHRHTIVQFKKAEAIINRRNGSAINEMTQQDIAQEITQLKTFFQDSIKKSTSNSLHNLFQTFSRQLASLQRLKSGSNYGRDYYRSGNLYWRELIENLRKKPALTTENCKELLTSWLVHAELAIHFETNPDIRNRLRTSLYIKKNRLLKKLTASSYSHNHLLIYSIKKSLSINFDLDHLKKRKEQLQLISKELAVKLANKNDYPIEKLQVICDQWSAAYIRYQQHFSAIMQEIDDDPQRLIAHFFGLKPQDQQRIEQINAMLTHSGQQKKAMPSVVADHLLPIPMDEKKTRQRFFSDSSGRPSTEPRESFITPTNLEHNIPVPAVVLPYFIQDEQKINGSNSEARTSPADLDSNLPQTPHNDHTKPTTLISASPMPTMPLTSPIELDFLKGYEAFSKENYQQATTHWSKLNQPLHPLACVFLHYLHTSKLYENYTLLPNFTAITIPAQVSWIIEQARQKNPHAIQALGYLHYQGFGVDKNNSLALSCFKKSQDQSDLFSLYHRGKCLSAFNYFDEAEKVFNNVLQLSDGYLPALIALGILLTDQRRLNEALIPLEKSTIVNPENSVIYYHLSRVYFLQGQYNTALEKIEKSLEINNRNLSYWKAKVKCLDKLKKPEITMNTINSALQLYPDNYSLNKKRRTLIQKLHHKKEAKKEGKPAYSSLMCEILSRLPITATYLNLRDYPFCRRADMEALAKLLADPARKINVLYLNNCNEQDLDLLEKSLTSNVQLQELHYSKNSAFDNTKPAYIRIQSYLCRNKLLRKSKITAQELRQLNLSEFNRDEINSTLEMLLAKHSYLTELNFNGCNYRSEVIKGISLFLKNNSTFFSHLKVLNLTNNQIGESNLMGLLILLDKTLESPRAVHLDIILNDNQLNWIDDDSINILNKLNNKNLKIHLAHNMSSLGEQLLKGRIDDKADANLFNRLETNNDGKPYQPVINLIPPTPQVHSRLTNHVFITPSNWLVGLVCPKEGEHAFLFLEGINDTCMRFFETYEISSNGMFQCNANLRKDMKSSRFLAGLDINDYYVSMLPITNIQGENLKENIGKWANKQIPYDIFLGGFSASHYINCLKWCRGLLAEIGINLPYYGLLPSGAAQTKLLWEKDFKPEDNKHSFTHLAGQFKDRKPIEQKKRKIDEPLNKDSDRPAVSPT